MSSTVVLFHMIPDSASANGIMSFMEQAWCALFDRVLTITNFPRVLTRPGHKSCCWYFAHRRRAQLQTLGKPLNWRSPKTSEKI